MIDCAYKSSEGLCLNAISDHHNQTCCIEKEVCHDFIYRNIDDIISHPSHYADGRKYEPKDVIRDWNLNFNLGSAVKYISRAGRKDDIIQDLKKAKQFIQFEIEALEEERKERI